MCVVMRSGSSAIQTIDVLGKAPGLLHPCMDLRQCPLPLASGTELNIAEARVATPNLRLVELYRGLNSWGASLNSREEAAEKAISEAVERFALGSVPRQLHIASARDIGAMWLDPRLCIEYLNEQVSENPMLRPFRVDEPRGWVQGVDRHDQKIYVLADMVFNPFVTPTNDRRVHTVATSSGMACHPVGVAAKHSALLEVVERDAFMRMWLSRTSPRAIDASSVEFVRSVAELVSQQEGVLRLFHLPSLASCVVLACIVAPIGIFLGLGIGEPVAACHKAAIEATAILVSPPNPSADPLPPEAVRSADDHVRLYSDRQMWRHASFIYASGESPLRLSALPPDAVGLDELERSAIFVPYTGIANENRQTWRCLLPGSIPMSFGYGMEPFGLSAVAEIVDPVILESVKSGRPQIPHPMG